MKLLLRKRRTAYPELGLLANFFVIFFISWRVFWGVVGVVGAIVGVLGRFLRSILVGS